MNETNRVALLEKENSELKAEREILFQTVQQMRESMNLLIGRYIVSNDSCEV